MPRNEVPENALPIADAPLDGTAVALWSDVWGWDRRIHRWSIGQQAWSYGRGNFCTIGGVPFSHFRLATDEEIELDEGGKTSRLPDLNLIKE